MQLDKKMLLNSCWRWLYYEGLLLAGLNIAYLSLKTGVHNYTLPQNLYLTITLITLSLLTLSLFATMLRGQLTITLNLYIYLVAAFLFASLVNFQTVLTIGVILATTFLYECYPFYLKRWRIFFAIKYTFDSVTIFILGLFLLWQNILTFTVVLFPIFFLVLILSQKIGRFLTKNINKLMS